MMRPILLMSCAVMLATVPLASASCHWCVGDVAEDCSALKPDDCAGSAQHLATHAPALLAELAEDPSGFACGEAGGENATEGSMAFRYVGRLPTVFGCWWTPFQP